MSWWDLGEHSGFMGDKLELFRITCPFCLEKGNFEFEHKAEKKKANSSKILHFDTLRCNNCTGYTMVLWSSAEHMIGRNSLYDFKVLPWPLKIDVGVVPEHWSKTVGRFWVQAHRNLSDENWDAAAIMARSALQALLREKGASGSSLMQEINDLASKGILPPIIKEWSHEVRELGNISAHPIPDQAPTNEKDAIDIVRFLDFILEYLYDLPDKIQKYRQRRNKG